MNSTKILFLRMLKNDILKQFSKDLGIGVDQLLKKDGLLAGQTISRSSIENFSSYRLMNSDEKKCVDLILSEVKSNNNVGSEKGKVMMKHIDSLVPTSYLSDAIDYKDVA